MAKVVKDEPRSIRAYSGGKWIIYHIPSPEEARAWSKATWGERHDPIERTKVVGGLPLEFPRTPKLTEAEARAIERKLRPRLTAPAN